MAGGTYFSASRQQYKSVLARSRRDGDNAILEYDSSTKPYVVEVLAISDNPDNMIHSDWWIEGALVFLERIYDRGETRSKCLERLRMARKQRIRHYELYKSTGPDNTTETGVASPSSLVDSDDVGVNVDSRTQPGDEDTIMRESDEATAEANTLESVGSRSADSPAVLHTLDCGDTTSSQVNLPQLHQRKQSAVLRSGNLETSPPQSTVNFP